MFPSHSAFVHVLGCALIASSGALVAQQFTSSVVLGTVQHPSGLVAADFHGSGALDFLIAYASSRTSGVEILSRLSNGTWGTMGRWGSGWPTGMVAAELNGDGRPEALVVQSFPGWYGLIIYSFD